MFEEERQAINKIDDELKKLFLKRQSIVAKIATYKYQHDLAIFDPERENAMKKRLSSDLDGLDLKYYQAFLEAILSYSKQYQSEIINKIKDASE